MATNITNETVDIIQTLVHDAFNLNSILDRVKTQLATSLACPIMSNIVHILAHKYPVNIGDKLGDLIEAYNESIKYGNIPQHEEIYFNSLDAFTKVVEELLVYQNELNIAYGKIMQNGDFHILVGLSKIIEEHNGYVEKAILWKDIVEKYGNDPSLDIAMKQFE